MRTAMLIENSHNRTSSIDDDNVDNTRGSDISIMVIDNSNATLWKKQLS